MVLTAASMSATDGPANSAESAQATANGAVKYKNTNTDACTPPAYTLCARLKSDEHERPAYADCIVVLALPAEAEEDKTKARFRDGILALTLPRLA